MKTQQLRALFIDLLDSPDGIPELTYQKMIDFANAHATNTCEDIWPATDSASGNNGVCVYLNEDTAQDLRQVALPSPDGSI